MKTKVIELVEEYCWSLRPGLLRRAVRIALTLLMLAGVAPHAAAQTTRWVVLKCKFSNHTEEPDFNPLFITGQSGMAGYWSEVSYGKMSMAGSTVYGWYTLSMTLEEAATLTRDGRIQACIAKATDPTTPGFATIGPSDRVIAILNTAIDSGSVNGNVVLDPKAWNMAFAGHEMGHCFGLDHSFDDSPTSYDSGSDGRPGAYGDGWDIMSAMNFGNTVPSFTGVYGASGPGVNAYNLTKLGVMPDDRIVTWNGTDSLTITLAALNRPAANGYLMAKVPLDPADLSHYYTIEFRRKTDWDRGIPRETVLIHEVRPDGLCYLIRANGGAERLPGQTYRDTTNNVVISVLGINPVSETVTVTIARNQVWADFAYPGLPDFPEEGSFASPYNTVAESAPHVGSGGTLTFKTGTSSETPSIKTPMTLKAFNGPVTIGFR